MTGRRPASRGFDPREFKGKRAGVLGLGLSGKAAALLLARKGFKVFASDARPRAEAARALGASASLIDWEAGGHSEKVFACAFVVKSPGLKPDAPVLLELSRRKIPVFSEMETAIAFCPPCRIVAITGTNGKTTTTALTGALFKAGLGARKVHVCGNIGLPLSARCKDVKKGDVVILEASSYQLEDSRSFHPHAGALLNVTPDHIDHHGGAEAYSRAKARLFQEQMEEDFCVFNASDPETLALSRACRSERLFFGSAAGIESNADADGAGIRVRLPNVPETLLPAPRLAGRHNLENAMAAALLALRGGVPAKAAARALASFRGVEHRLEEVGTVKGLRCINDSKATNVASTFVALQALAGFNGGIYLILGGLDKGSPYAPLAPLIRGKVKAVLTIGSAAGKIAQELEGSAPIEPCGTLEKAVDAALRMGSPGDALLLSPACASFDQFKNFEDRGRSFKSILGLR